MTGQKIQERIEAAAKETAESGISLSPMHARAVVLHIMRELKIKAPADDAVERLADELRALIGDHLRRRGRAIEEEPR